MIELRPVTADNFQECIRLKVKDEQAKFCVSNMYSIAESKVKPPKIPMCIFADGQMVGFAMYGPEHSDDGLFMSIDRFMIDGRFQGKGYGKLAFAKLIETIQRDFACKEIFLSYVLENVVAANLYKGFGFVETGEFPGDECIVKLTL